MQRRRRKPRIRKAEALRAWEMAKYRVCYRTVKGGRWKQVAKLFPSESKARSLVDDLVRVGLECYRIERVANGQLLLAELWLAETANGEN